MKVKGIVTQKYDKKRNLYKGDVIELDADAKAVEAVKDAVKLQSVDGETMCWAESVEAGALATTPKGDKFHNKYSNSTYRVSGKVVIRTLNLKNDKLQPAKEESFDIVFCDCLDALKQPDLKVEEFKIK